MLDTLIRGGWLADGTGAAPFHGDVAGNCGNGVAAIAAGERRPERSGRILRHEA